MNMISLVKTLCLSTVLLAASTTAVFAPHRRVPHKWEKLVSTTEIDHSDASSSRSSSAAHKPHGTPLTATSGNATFAQLIEHKNPHLGTFPQLYFWSTEFWRGPGSPVVLFTPGEVNASGYGSYLTSNRTTGRVAQEIGAAVIVLEHRYWGQSSPFAELSTGNMRYLTLENSISDLTRFAQRVRLPFDTKRESRPARAPWVLMGGSYSGALSAWTAATQPGTFWAYHASSAPVEAIQGLYPPKGVAVNVTVADGESRLLAVLLPNSARHAAELQYRRLVGG